jgi:hypothetical protein
MVYKVVAVFDRALMAFGRPVFVAASGAAIRSFQNEINRDAPDNELSQHPEDFELFLLGTFDDASGKFVDQEPAIQLAIGKQLRVKGGV